MGSSFFSFFLGDGEADGLDPIRKLLGLYELNVPKSDYVSQMSTVLITINGIAMEEISEDTNDCGPSRLFRSSTCRGTTATLPSLLKRFAGKERSLSLAEFFACCLPLLYGMVGR